MTAGAPLPPAEPPGVELAPGVRAPQAALRWQYARGSGPGGQNVNKVNTKAELWLDPARLTGLSPGAKARLIAAAGRRMTDAGELHLSADAERSQEANRQAVLQRLRQLIVAALPEPKHRKKTRPSRASKRRRLDAKKHRGTLKAQRRGAM